MAVRKTSSGRWRVDFRDRRGRRQRVTFDTKAEAKDFAGDTRQAIRRGLYIDPKLSPTVKEAATEWLQSRADRAPGTYEFYKSHLDNHVFPRIGDLKVADIDVVTIEREVRDPLVAADKLVTANKVLTTLTTFWTWAANRKYASPEVRSPAELAERVRVPPDHRKKRGPERVYTPDEIRRIIDSADSLKFKVAFALLSLGTRREEVLGFKWADISSAWDSIRVQRAVTLAKGPAETKRIAKLKDVKSTAGHRPLPLPPPIATILKKWRLQCPENDLDLILPNEGGGILHPSTLYDALKRAQALSGVRKLDIKAFRHTFATALIEGGEADTQVARLMGHADTTVTRRVCAHAFDRP